MRSRNLAFMKGRDLAGHNVALWTTLSPRAIHPIDNLSRHLSCSASRASDVIQVPQTGQQEKLKGKAWERKNEKFANRDFFLSVLGSSATKREAQAYLQRFTPPKDALVETKSTVAALEKTAQPPQQYGVNLGNFYASVRAVEESPKFVQQPFVGVARPINGPIHVALVKIRDPQHMDDDTVDGIARTLSQLGKLGLTSTVVVTCDSHADDTRTPQSLRQTTLQQVDRLVIAIDKYGGSGSRKVDNVIGFSKSVKEDNPSTACLRGRTHVKYRKLLMTPLERGVIPVIPSIGHTDDTQRAISIKADDILLALTQEFAGFQTPPLPDENPNDMANRLEALRSEVSLDRLIILDPLGGIPAPHRPNGYHVFLNMEQEFETVKEDLLKPFLESHTPNSEGHDAKSPPITHITNGNLVSGLAEADLNLQPSRSEVSSPDSKAHLPPANLIHLQNLELVRKVLSLLPSSSSALLTTPEEAANSWRQNEGPFQVAGVRTRRQQNPLIHNLLTDKPVFSSSLPAGRLGHGNLASVGKNVTYSKRISQTTFAKRGVSVTIFPDPKTHPWKPPHLGEPQLTLTDSRIDLPRLVHLIDDSFNRRIDIQQYLKRVNHRIAGVIIAGEYEGGALLTWELPPGVPDDGSEESRSRMVPYLDKFAVLKRSQGAGGVADIVFKAMVKDCFPNGVCWRSRRDNPVNKWYFERSRGTWKIQDSNWTMFWTTSELGMRGRVFEDYEAVCRTIEPSWADKKAVID